MQADMPLPKYHQIYLVLKEGLLEGKFAQGMPGEISLVQQFGVARVTVRKALELLSSEGLITRQRGRGTVVKPAALSSPAVADAGARRSGRTGLLDNLVSISMGTRIKVVDLSQIQASQAVAQALDIPVGDAVQKAVRVRSTRNGPVSHITTYVPARLTSHFGRAELAREPILVLLEKSGVNLGRAEQHISARLADASTAKLLEVPVGSALLAVRRLVFDSEDRPIQWLHGLYRPDRYEYEMKLSRVGDIDARVWVSSELSAQFH
ncbi:GntR family transcriptional regulator [Ottowia sp.]|uniref:GntR family transcriptional regulator n=1 Tax=Ottowia sp. TaxID=1898956 RepID=UPI0025E9BFDF|nr:GntR family transcriptional regulator [Ottowia sp.]MBK6745637.1 GntR family transcriptional regulator [Ottowia sp.]